MEQPHHSLADLFAQLGLDNEPAAMREFVARHRPLPMTVSLSDAPFWSVSQAALIKQKLSDDSDWALIVDTLNVQLRERPDIADLQAADAVAVLPGESKADQRN